jgi:hypothetical protein
MNHYVRGPTLFALTEFVPVFPSKFLPFLPLLFLPRELVSFPPRKVQGLVGQSVCARHSDTLLGARHGSAETIRGLRGVCDLKIMSRMRRRGKTLGKRPGESQAATWTVGRSERLAVWRNPIEDASVSQLLGSNPSCVQKQLVFINLAVVRLCSLGIFFNRGLGLAKFLRAFQTGQGWDCPAVLLDERVFLGSRRNFCRLGYLDQL